MNTPATTIRKSISGVDAQTRILDAVDDLFYREGARAVGVDAVVKAAGVNKMSLYRQFESKDALLMHYLERSDARFWSYFDASVAKHPGNPKAQLQQFFDDLTPRICRPGYRGCPFVNIAAEFPDPDHPTRKRVAENKRQLMTRLEAMAAQAGAHDPHQLAAGLALLIEGAYAGSQTYAPGNDMLPTVPAVAAALIEGACRPAAAA